MHSLLKTKGENRSFLSGRWDTTNVWFENDWGPGLHVCTCTGVCTPVSACVPTREHHLCVCAHMHRCACVGGTRKAWGPVLVALPPTEQEPGPLCRKEKADASSLTMLYELQLVKWALLNRKDRKSDNNSCCIQYTVCLATGYFTYVLSLNPFKTSFIPVSQVRQLKLREIRIWCEVT